MRVVNLSNEAANPQLAEIEAYRATPPVIRQFHASAGNITKTGNPALPSSAILSWDVQGAATYCFDLKPKGSTCEATVGLLKEGDEIADEFKGSPAINAALIAAAQKVEHYEMATYGCLHEWAELLGSKKAGSLLKEILNEEKGANKSLNVLAHSKSNAEAMGEMAGAVR